MRLALILLLVPAGLYLAAVIALYLAQDRLLFPIASVGHSPPLPAGTEQWALDRGGVRLAGVHLQPTAPLTTAPVLLGFGGNAWNAAAAAVYLHDLYPHADVVVFYFRGYPPSGGRADAAALLDDAPAVYDLTRAHFPARPIVAVGFSVGTAMAARVARVRRPAGAIFVTPFDSLTRVARSHFSWVPVGLLLRQRLEPARDIAAAAMTRMATITAGDDEVVPRASSDGFRAAAGTQLVFNRTIARAGHNSVYDRSDFRRAMVEALAAVTTAR